MSPPDEAETRLLSSARTGKKKRQRGKRKGNTITSLISRRKNPEQIPYARNLKEDFRKTPAGGRY